MTQELEKLLARPVEKVRQWEGGLYDELTGPLANSLVLYGAGGLGQKTLRGLRKLGIEPLAFTDNNPNLHGLEINGVAVLSPDEAAQKFGTSAVFIVTVFMDSAPGGIEPLIKKLNGLGCEHATSFVYLYWKYPDLFLPHYVYDLPHKVITASDKIRAAFSLFEDNSSQKEFLAQIKWRLDPDYDQIPAPAEHEIYFPPDLIALVEDEVFIDCGAYDGDTVRSFIRQSGGKFDKLFAFEPDPVNYKKLVELVASLPLETARHIETSDLALGAASELLYFDAQGVASSSLSSSGGIQIKSEPLDSLPAGEAPTFIKMDIEGAEKDALKGASQCISNHLPILAISVYHRQDHIWEIPLFIHALSGAYHFHLRRHHPRVLDDLVLYAIPTRPDNH